MSTCPVMTDAQRAAGRPWAILIFASMLVHLVFLACFLTYSIATRHSFDVRVWWIAFVSSWLIQRGITDYAVYRLSKIVDHPQRSGWQQRSHRMVFILMLVILIGTLLRYWW